MKGNRLNTINYTNDRRKKDRIYISPTKEIKNVSIYKHSKNDKLLPEIRIISDALSQMECAIIPERCLDELSQVINSRRIIIRETVFDGIIK